MAETPKGDDRCSRCARGIIVAGYGLMGGGCGFYWFCDDDACDFFFKIQDRNE